MAREKQNWSAMRADIRRLLREEDAAVSFWSDVDLLQLVNECRDEVDARLAETYEGYGEKSVATDLVAGQAHYESPGDTNRILRVCRQYSDGREFPLNRLDRYGEATIAPGGSSSGVMDYFTYRLEDEWIVLEPVPNENYTNGLKIYYEYAPPKIDDDGDDVSRPGWPFFCELLVKYMVCVAAFEMEGAMGQTNTPWYTSYIKKRDILLAQLMEYAETRSYGRQYRTPYWLGD